MVSSGFPTLLQQDMRAKYVLNEVSNVYGVVAESGFVRGYVYFVTVGALRGYSYCGPTRGPVMKEKRESSYLCSEMLFR